MIIIMVIKIREAITLAAGGCSKGSGSRVGRSPIRPPSDHSIFNK